MEKTIIIPALLLFAIFLTGCENQSLSQNSNSEKQSISATKTKQKGDRIEIIDFHSMRRCASCLGMERNMKETLEKNFKEELKDGEITFQSINVEESNPQTTLLVQKYQATGSSLFINDIRGEKDHIEQDPVAWRFARQDEQFQAYFKEKIEKLLN